MSDKLKKFVTMLRWFDLGRDKIMQRFAGALTFVFSGVTMLKVYGISLTFPQIVLFTIVGFIGVFIMGFFYDKKGLWREEIVFDFDRNPMIKYLVDRQDELHNKMEEMRIQIDNGNQKSKAERDPQQNEGKENSGV